MVRYMTMKRITQILASTLFVLTVLTVYLAFDFALSTAATQRTLPHKRNSHEHEHDDDQPHLVTKITKKRSITQIVPHQANKPNQTVKQDPHGNPKRPISNPKNQVRVKPGSFHKGKTGVKVNKPLKFLKGQQKRLSPTTTSSQHKDKPHR